jgi:hypothetical protein
MCDRCPMKRFHVLLLVFFWFCEGIISGSPASHYLLSSEREDITSYITNCKSVRACLFMRVTHQRSSILHDIDISHSKGISKCIPQVLVNCHLISPSKNPNSEAASEHAVDTVQKVPIKGRVIHHIVRRM